jgi:hypothetical protein
MNTALPQARITLFIKVLGVTLALASAFLLPAWSHAQPSVSGADARSSIDYPDSAKINLTRNIDSRHENNKQIQVHAKSSSADDSRGLSAFLAIGIAINIIMAIVFTWWFRREWKKNSPPRTNQ